MVEYKNHRAKILQHIGSGRTEQETVALIHKAQEWIKEQTHQIPLFTEPKQKILLVDRGECLGVTHLFGRQFLLSCLNEWGLSDNSPLLLDLAIMRFIEPSSKHRAIEMLSFYFGINYSQRFYRNIPKLITYKKDVEDCAFRFALERLQEPFYFILYDVTTLYFETFHSDDLRQTGFSKDNKPQQPQIVIGLLVTSPKGDTKKIGMN